jgi:hypothetical protein
MRPAIHCQAVDEVRMRGSTTGIAVLRAECLGDASRVKRGSPLVVSASQRSSPSLYRSPERRQLFMTGEVFDLHRGSRADVASVHLLHFRNTCP